jgi:hypothetical protein
MQIQSVQNKTVRTNAVDLKSQSFEIGNAEMIIEILRNKLYSNPIQTLVQEYISNARDANREVNSKQKIKITLPTEDNLILSIRDFGPGLSPERVADVFVKYGNSTKRDTNRQVGGFGIGAKSAWAYADSFVILTYHGGKAYHYVAHVTAKHTGSLDLVSESDTSEPNGTEIQIPVKTDDLDDFYNAVDRAVKHWDGGEFPEFLGDTIDPVHSIRRFGRFEACGGDHSMVIVLDGIPYPIPRDFESEKQVEALHELVKQTTCLHFKTGEIDVAASREAITVNDKNRKAIIKAASDGKAALLKYIRKEVTSGKTLLEAMEKHGAISENFSHSEEFKLTFQGDAFTIEICGGLTSDLFQGLSLTRYSHSNGSYYRRRGKRTIFGDKLPSEVDFRNANIVFTDDETSHANQNRRMKTISEFHDAFLLSGVVNSPNLLKLASHLGLKGTSSLGPANLRKSHKRESTGDVLLNHYVKTTSKQTVAKMVNLDRIESKYVYVVSNVSGSDGYKGLNALLSACGLNFALVNEANAKRIEGNPNFITFKAFISQWTKWIPKDKQASFMNTLKGLILEGNGRYWDTHKLEVYKAVLKLKLKDKALIKAMRTLLTFNNKRVLKIETGRSYRNGLSLQDSNLQAIIKGIPELVEYQAQEKAMIAFKKKYILLSCVDYPVIDKVKTGPALALYLDSAFKKGR